MEFIKRYIIMATMMNTDVDPGTPRTVSNDSQRSIMQRGPHVKGLAGEEIKNKKYNPPRVGENRRKIVVQKLQSYFPLSIPSRPEFHRAKQPN